MNFVPTGSRGTTLSQRRLFGERGIAGRAWHIASFFNMPSLTLLAPFLAGCTAGLRAGGGRVLEHRADHALIGRQAG